MPENVSDLDPKLLEQARRGLQMENTRLMNEIKQLRIEYADMKRSWQTKTEQLKKQKEKTEDYEMECDKMLLKQQLLEEQNNNLKEDGRRHQREKGEAENAALQLKKDVIQLRGKIEKMQSNHERAIQKVRQEEAQRAENFIASAKKQIQQIREQERAKARNGGNNTARRKNNAFGVMQQDMVAKQKENNRQRQVWEQRMKQLEETTLTEFENIRLEQIKLQQSLQTQVEKYITLRVKMSEKDEELKQLNKVVAEKDKTLQRQTEELQQFGELKLKSDQIHQQQFAKAQETIFSLKKQLARMKRHNADQPQQQQQSGWQNLGYPDPKSNVSSIIELKRKQALPVKLRGGGRKTMHKSGAPSLSATATAGIAQTTAIAARSRAGSRANRDNLPNYGSSLQSQYSSDFTKNLLGSGATHGGGASRQLSMGSSYFSTSAGSNSGSKFGSRVASPAFRSRPPRENYTNNYSTNFDSSSCMCSMLL